MRVFSSLNNFLVYSLDSNDADDILVNRKKKSKPISAKKDQELSLIADFGMPNSCSKIEATRDNKHIFILGSYPYQIKCYEYLNMSEKFLRGIDMHCDKFKLISADDSKFCALKSDRNLEFHTGRGIHHNIIVPDLVTDLNLDLQSASMYMISNTKIFSLNLEFGKFQRTIEQSEFSYTVGDFNEYHSLYSAGKLDGSVAFYDPRTPNQIGEVKCASNSSRDFEVSSIKFRNETMLGVGLSSGEINLFDIRSKTPILIKDHYFRFPISKLQYSDNEYQRDIILSADQKAIKIWQSSTGKTLTSIDPKSKINDFTIIKDSGLVMMACEEPMMKNYFVPTLGPAPIWCNFLDDTINSAEKDPLPLDEFGNQKFIDMKEIEALRIKNLIGTSTLKAYMHGYLIAKDVHERIVLQNSEEDEQNKLETLEKFYQNKAKGMVDQIIGGKFKTLMDKRKTDALVDPEKINRPMVNQEFHEKYKSAKLSSFSRNIVEDDRFKNLFQDEDFEIQSNTESYIMNNAIAETFSAKNKNTADQSQSRLGIDNQATLSQDSENDSSDDEFNRATKKMSKDLHDFRYSERLERKKIDMQSEIEINSNNNRSTQVTKNSGKEEPSKPSRFDLNNSETHDRSSKISSLLSKRNNNIITNSSEKGKKKSKKQALLEKHMEERRQNVRNTAVKNNKRIN